MSNRLGWVAEGAKARALAPTPRPERTPGHYDASPELALETKTKPGVLRSNTASYP